MLSIFALTSAASASSYYEQDNYYTDDSQEAKSESAWYGKGAKHLGLSGSVDKQQFSKFLEGKLPNGEQLGRINKEGKLEHRPGYDLTFSAPKSVSILGLVGGQQQFIDAHKEAVRYTLDYLEQNFAETRIVVDEQSKETIRETTGNWIISQFHHDTSRALDPQVHDHNIIQNATLRSDGKWRSITGDKLFQYKMMSGMVYRAKLSHTLKQAGTELRVDHKQGFFEVKQVPQSLIDTFSKRRFQIKCTLEQLGFSSSKAAEIATLDTRDAKLQVNREELKTLWQNTCTQHGFDAGANYFENYKENVNSEEVANQSLKHAIGHLSEQEAVFYEKDIITRSLAHGLGDVLLEDVQQSISQALEQKKLIALEDNLYTTPQAKALESFIVEQMHQGKEKVASIDTHYASLLHKFLHAYQNKAGPTVDNFLARHSLTEGQQQAAKLILTTQDKIIGIQGYAGTGKTHMFGVVKDYAKSHGYQCIGLSPKSKTAEELESASGIKSQTLSSFLTQMQSKKVSPGRWNKVVESPSSTLFAKINSKIETFKAKLEVNVDKINKTLIILDESSMASNLQLAQLLVAVNKTDARLILVGDTKQYDGVGAGKPFELLQKSGMQTAEMKDIMRQKNEDLLQAVYHSYEGEFKEALDKITNITESKSPSYSINQLAKDYLNQTQQQRDNSLVLAATNQQCDVLNQLIRKQLAKEGILKGNTLSTNVLVSQQRSRVQLKQAKYHTPGHLIRLNKNYRVSQNAYFLDKDKNAKTEFVFKRGEYYQITKTDQEKNIVYLQAKDKSIIAWRPDRVAAGRSGTVETYSKQTKELQLGDKLFWKRNDRALGLKNSDKLTVHKIKDSMIIGKTQQGKLVTIDLTQAKNQHFNHAYASTIYMSQGLKGRNEFLLLPSDLNKQANQKAFRVAISRSTHECRIYTDDKEQLVRNIEKHSGQKTSALEQLQTKDPGNSASKENELTK